MANHGFVKTKKFMDGENVHELLTHLNETIFKNVLKIEQEDLFWAVECKDETIFGYRKFWLNTKRTLELRHSGADEFFQWVGVVILNEIAVKFNGKISDEGCEESWEGKPNKYPEFINWVEALYLRLGSPLERSHKDEFYKEHFEFIMKCVPEEHRVSYNERYNV
jgi:hypothetical protein